MRRSLLSLLGFVLALTANGLAQPAITQQCSLAYTPGGTLAVTNTFTYSGQLLSLLWRPQLPDGWVLVSAYGDGHPEVGLGGILWTGAMPASPVTLVYSLGVPGDAVGEQPLRATVEYQLSGMVNPAAAQASPAILPLFSPDPDVRAIHASSADYVAGGTLRLTNRFDYSRRLLSLLWRPILPAGWSITSVSGTGNPELRGDEIMWLGQSMPTSPIEIVCEVKVPANASGPQTIRAAVDCQFAEQTNPTTIFATPNPLVIQLEDKGIRAVQSGPTEYQPGGNITLSGRFEYVGTLLSLTWYPQLPVGWTLVSVTGNGNPELQNGAIVHSGQTLPASPITLSYLVQVPPDATGLKTISASSEYLLSGRVNPRTANVQGVPLTLTNAPVQGRPQFSLAARQADGRMKLGLAALPTSSFRIQSSVDLRDWGTLLTTNSPNRTLEWIDPLPATAAKRFYRIIVP